MSWAADIDEYQIDELNYTDEEDENEPQKGLNDLDEDSDIDRDGIHSHGPKTSKEKRRAQDEIFRAFALAKTHDITAKEVKENIDDIDDEKLSIKNILAKQDFSAAITNPRDYQTELFQKARDENIIAVLDTGSGKTHIATLLLRHVLDEELESRAKGDPPKIAFFLVDSVNLVFQQANVLRCGLDQNVEGICGAMGASLWQKPTWDKHFAQNMAIVCTAEVLVQCMMHSFIKMNQINLLVFDEAHHAKSNHPYARLIKDYYIHEPDLAKRPRIFGMTASPVDANVDIQQAAKDLERLLHCKIATASDLKLLQNNISKPEEKVKAYAKLKPMFETPFHQQLKSQYGEIRPFYKLFEDSKLISSELGRWASDFYWSFALSEAEGRKIELRQERLFHMIKEDSIVKLDKEIAKLKEAAGMVTKHQFGSPKPNLEDLSSKVLVLHEWLQLYYSRTGEARSIVFVERRSTARLLKLIFANIGGPNLRCDILVGNATRLGDQKLSLRSQVMTLASFRKGELNCLFATSVAEEGLDVPQCNLVVRFDLYKTMIAYVQSRGRARHRNSTYLHMIEHGNANHITLLHHAKLSEQIMRDFCNGLPSDRLINEVDDDVSRLLDSDVGLPTHTDPVSGAKLTFRSSLSTLAHFVACLPSHSQEINLQPTYVNNFQSGQFLCEVVLPDCSPIISRRGMPFRRKAIAKCSAAYEMCLELRKKNYLDENLLPTYTKQLPAMRNSLLAVSEKKKGMYLMRLKPNFWEFGYGTVPGHFYLTVLDMSAGLDRSHQPLGLVTRQRLPALPKFPIFLNDGRPSNVISLSLRRSLPATEETIRLFNVATLRVYHHIFAKKYEDDVSKMSYWLVPILHKSKSADESTEPSSLIDWDQVRAVHEQERYPWTPEMKEEFLANRYLVDPHDGGRRFYSVAVRPDMRALDPVPETVPRHKWMDNILDYSVSLWKKNRAHYMSQFNTSQPVMEVAKIPFRRNLLAIVEDDEADAKMKINTFICPEPLWISTLSTPFVAMCYVFPAIIHRFEAYLVALDACTLLGLDISPKLALEAMTKDSDNSDEHGEEKINFKSGMGANYERLEFMGDCFLKMATSISTFVQQPEENEFEFHVRRMCMLCNKNLFETAMKFKLYEYVRTMAFSRRTWYPEGIKMTWGKGSNRIGPQVIKHSLSDKSVADVCEALIGAAFIQDNKSNHWDPSNWDQAVKAVKLLTDSDDHLMEKFSDYFAAYEKPKYQTAEATASQLDLAKKVEEQHPYRFKYPRLLRSAFIHPSQAYMWENIPNYQRLEFLGDSLLDQAFIMYLFYKYPDKDPHWLTEHKMPMVSNRFLASVCVDLRFHKHIRQNNAGLTAQIREYITQLEDAEEEARGKEDYWLYWSNTPEEPPKCLADVIEAFVAALFVDSEFDFRVVQKFFDLHMYKYFADMHLYDNWARSHPVTRMTKLLQVNLGCTNWRLSTMSQKALLPGDEDRVIAMVQIHWMIFFDATASSSRYAKLKACSLALEKLEGLPPYEFRKVYGCNCEHAGEEPGLIEELGALRIGEDDVVGSEGPQAEESVEIED